MFFDVPKATSTVFAFLIDFYGQLFLCHLFCVMMLGLFGKLMPERESIVNC